jgi:hypothetical protein
VCQNMWLISPFLCMVSLKALGYRHSAFTYFPTVWQTCHLISSF